MSLPWSTPLIPIPDGNSEELDLLWLFKQVTSLGGALAVTKQGQWKELAMVRLVSLLANYDLLLYVTTSLSFFSTESPQCSWQVVPHERALHKRGPQGLLCRQPLGI